MKQNKATEFMQKGYVWSDSVLLAVCQDYNIENEIIPRIATGFAGGMGNTGSVCGAVIGAVMAINLVRERENTMEGYLQHAAVIKEFRSRFEEEMETIECRELTGVDFSTKEGMEKIMNSDISQTVCFPAVGMAYYIVSEILKEGK